MEYSILAGYYHRLEGTSSRLGMTDILVELMEKVPTELLGRIIYLTLGKLAPDYEGIEFGIAEKLVIRALAFTTGFPEHEVLESWQEKGDPGNAAEELLAKKMQRSLFSTPLTIERVFSTFEKLAATSGKGTQDTRIKYLAELLHDATPLDGRYIVRTVVGKLRLGIADMTVIDALAVHSLRKEKLIAPVAGERDSSAPTGPPDDCAEPHTSDGGVGPAEDREQIDAEDSEQIEAEEGGESENEESDPPGITVAEKKEVRDAIERVYNIHPDIGLIAERMVSGGLEKIKGIGMQPGIPIRVMLAERLSTPEAILEKMGGEAAFEHKYDGIRIQGHIKKNGITLFTRQQEDATSQFPDVVESLREMNARDEHEMIVEGECVPVDVNTGAMLPFQMVSRRRGRKYDLDAAVEEFPVVLFLFDILYLDGEALIGKPFPERRLALESAVTPTEKVRLSNLRMLSEPEQVEVFFLESLDAGCEGLIAKSTAEDSVYRAGARGWQWIKFKRDYRSELVDTIDLTVVGGFYGKGRRAGTFGALLMAAYDRETDSFETVCKLGSGFDDAFLEEMNSMFKPLEQKSVRVKSQIQADVWFEPKVVFEILAAEITLSPIHTCARGVLKEDAGIAVRFPRYTGIIRADKGPEDATSSGELVEMYGLQVKGASPKNDDLDPQ